ncbi:MAG: hypothetical protein HKN20_02690 [Gemmatimonadetes bacterium]|nr:hypothetical protein [Gemmatimonadota bacterium]
MMRTLILAGLFLFAGRAPAQEFTTWWFDGKAELSGYELTVSRYGEERTGSAVLIYVTEPFSESKRTKLDYPARAPKGDQVSALKLNMVRDFQTGIYDYNTMVSSFVRTDDFSPLKTSFSGADWCGHVYQGIEFHDGRLQSRLDSYFENESGERELPIPEGGIAEDHLFILLRGLRGAFLAPGESRTLPLLTGVLQNRLVHEPLRWVDATITRRASAEAVTVPAGTFDAIVYDIAIDDGRTGAFRIESAWPHRLVEWELPPDLRGALTGSTRLPYWSLHANGDESYRAQIGLK